MADLVELITFSSIQKLLRISFDEPGAKLSTERKKKKDGLQ